jgi:hypothetical protein
MMDNFADAPMSIDEFKANREDDASLMKPRSVLVELLRGIDSGEINPTVIVVCHCEIDENGNVRDINWNSASPNCLLSIGLLDRVRYMINCTVETR